MRVLITRTSFSFTLRISEVDVSGYETAIRKETFADLIQKVQMGFKDLEVENKK